MGNFLGLYRGVVINNADPEKRGRLILQVPQVLGTQQTQWALPCWPAGWNRSLMHDHVFVDNDTGYQAGGSSTERLRHKLLIAVPGPGSSVWVSFENGDAGSPVWVGMGTNTQIADALLGSDSTAGGGAAGDGSASGDGSLGPSVTPSSGGGGGGSAPTHEHVYPVVSVNGRTGSVAGLAEEEHAHAYPVTSVNGRTGVVTGLAESTAPAAAVAAHEAASDPHPQYMTLAESNALYSAGPANMATTDTTQTITGAKTFSQSVTISSTATGAAFEAIYTGTSVGLVGASAELSALGYLSMVSGASTAVLTARKSAIYMQSSFWDGTRSWHDEGTLEYNHATGFDNYFRLNRRLVVEGTIQATEIRDQGARVYSAENPPPATTKTVRIPHTFTISGDVLVASGDTNYIPPFFVPVPTGQSVSVVGVRHRINSGTSVVVTFGRTTTAGSYGALANITVTPTTTYTATSYSVADGESLSIVVSSPTGSPKNMTFTVYLNYTV